MSETSSIPEGRGADGADRTTGIADANDADDGAAVQNQPDPYDIESDFGPDGNPVNESE
jgi:hypothetical protein